MTRRALHALSRTTLEDALCVAALFGFVFTMIGLMGMMP